MPPFVLSCLAFLGSALPGSTLGMLWPLIRISVHEPVGALGIMLVAGIAAQVVSSAVTGRIMTRVRQGPLLTLGITLMAGALAMESAASAMWLLVVVSAVFSAGFGIVNTALNVYAAARFGPRNITWMHASYGLGATLGPLLVTVLLTGGAGWRLTVASMSVLLAVIALLLAATGRRWEPLPRPAPVPRDKGAPAPRRRARLAERAGLAERAWIAAAFIAVETGVEVSAGVWGYVFLTSGRGLPAAGAGVAVSAFWAMMFAGRALLGPVAERAGASRVLATAVAGVPAGAVLMAVPGPAPVAVAGMMLLGLAAAPVFPLLTLTTAERVGEGGAAAAVSLQAAASAIGSAALPSGIGLVIGVSGAGAVGPALLVLGLAMCAVYGLALRPAKTLAASR
jgi:fucose permease